MKTKYGVTVILFFVILITSSYGQLTESYFNDMEIKAGGRIETSLKGEDFLIYGGSSFDKYRNQPAITKIDTLGNIIWTTTRKDTSGYIGPNTDVYELFESNGYIYALMIKWGSNEFPKEMWKVNATNGDIEWKQPFYADYSLTPRHLIDYNDSTFLFGYFEFYGRPKFAFISKTDGETLSIHSAGVGEKQNFGLAKDSDLNIYYTHLDVIYKVDGQNPDSLIWKSDLPRFPRIGNFLDIHIDNNDNIYLFALFDKTDGSVGSGKVISIAASDGSLLWDTETQSPNVTDVFYVEDEEYIYATWETPSYGSGDNFYRTFKINKNTGILEWRTIHKFSDGPAASTAIDIDNNSDLFITGYYERTRSIGEGSWGILKLDGQSGASIYETTISLDSLVQDDYSAGKASCVINNKPYFLGNLQISTDVLASSVTTFVEIDNKTGSQLQRKLIAGTHQFPSKIIQIETYQKSHVAVLKQVGRHIELEVYDANSILQWKKEFTNEDFLFGTNMIISRDGFIVISAYDKVKSIFPPNYYNEETRNIYLFKLDLNGEIIQEQSFEVNEANTFPLEILDVGIGTTFLFYTRGDGTRFRKFNAQGVSEEQGFSVIYQPVHEKAKITIESNNYILFFYKTAIARINRGNLDFQTFPLIDAMQNVNFVQKIGEDKILVSGQKENNKGVLILLNAISLNPIWEKNYEANSDIYQTALNVDASNIIAIGTQHNKVFISSLSSVDGQDYWSYVFDSPTGIEDFPTDISVDHNSGNITISGYSSSEGHKDIFILVFNNRGDLLEEYYPKGDPTGENIASCTEWVPDGSTWIGGQIQDSLFGKAGFIYKHNVNEKPSSISGSTYFDENGNGIKDSAEINLSLFKVALQPSNTIQFTDGEGKFIYYPDNGNYVLSTQPISNWRLSSDSTVYHVEVDSFTCLTGLDFGFMPIEDTTIITAMINSGFTRCNRFVDFIITAKNEGTVINEGLILLEVDARVQDFQFLNPPDTIFNDTLFGWRFSNLYPTETTTRKLKMEMPGIGEDTNLGDLLTINTYVVPDNLPQDTFKFKYTPEIRCAYDPNDKLVHPNRTDFDYNYTLFDELITYTIRFQNTGTDTAFNVIIRDTLDTNLDINSLELITSSHLDILEITLIDNHLELCFENIMLPDSNNTYETSQGYVTYAIRAKENLEEGTSITNVACIYFDFNPPIVTNTIENVMVSELPKLTSTNELSINQAVDIYPNPFSDFFTIERELYSQEAFLFSIFDITGRELKTVTIPLTSHKVSTTLFAKGLYFYQIINAEGKIIATGKLVKQ